MSQSAGPIRTISATRPVQGVTRLLAGMRIRKKLVFLHTCFSLVLAGVLALAMRPAVREVVSQAELHEATVISDLVLSERRRMAQPSEVAAEKNSPNETLEQTVRRIGAQLGGSVEIRSGTEEGLGLTATDASRARSRGHMGSVPADPAFQPRGSREERNRRSAAVGFDPSAGADGGGTGGFILTTVNLAGARAAVVRLYILLTIALLAVYALVALALEAFVLPQHVYGPIRTMLDADQALQEGRSEGEIIRESEMPADELGEIMRSRNRSVVALRAHERDLAAALGRLEAVATDLQRKNHLLEAARRNLADADRLASLGMMSAGIAHELNTPLAVLKGLVERLHESTQRNGSSEQGGRGDSAIGADETALMLRVVGRLERLSESLLDFARVRPHRSVSASVGPLLTEAWTLVTLDRMAKRVRLEADVQEGLTAWCDPDRILQVFVNLLRNAVDAMEVVADPVIRVTARRELRESPPRPWAVVTIQDNGPGIDPALMDRLFQPFVTTRLDSEGTGLGLAVAYGIVREHGGVILARNRGSAGRDGRTGAVFEVLLPEADGETAAGPAVSAAVR